MTPESNLLFGLFNMSKGLIWAWTELTELIGLMYENLLISQKQLFQVHNLGLKGTHSLIVPLFVCTENTPTGRCHE